MRLLSDVLLAGIAAVMLTASAPVAAQIHSYVVVRGSLEAGRMMRERAIDRCAATMTQSYFQSAQPMAGQPRFDIVGFDYPINGTLRVHGFARMERPDLDEAEPRFTKIQFSCDVDSGGNIRKLRIG